MGPGRRGCLTSLEVDDLAATLAADLQRVDDRRARGVFFTPPDVAARLTALAVESSPHGPATTVVDPACGAGVFLLAAGLLLLTPGFVTDAVGLLLFVPALRALARHNLVRYLRASGRVEIWPGGPGPHASGLHGRGGDVIDGEYHEIPTDSDPHEDDGKNQDRRQSHGTLPEP